MLYPSARQLSDRQSSDSRFSQVLSDHSQSSEIDNKTLLVNQPMLTPLDENKISYFNTLSSLEQSIESQKKSLRGNHFDLALACENIGHDYYQMGEYLQALSFFQQSLEIRKRTSPLNCSHLSMCHYNIAQIFFQMKEYEKALLAYTTSAHMIKESLSSNDKHLADCYENISLVYYRLGEYDQARAFSKQSIDITTTSIPHNQP